VQVTLEEWKRREDRPFLNMPRGIPIQSLLKRKILQEAEEVAELPQGALCLARDPVVEPETITDFHCEPSLDGKEGSEELHYLCGGST